MFLRWFFKCVLVCGNAVLHKIYLPTATKLILLSLKNSHEKQFLKQNWLMHLVQKLQQRNPLKLLTERYYAFLSPYNTTAIRE